VITLCPVHQRYKQLGALCDELLDWCEPPECELSLPSLRAGQNFSLELIAAGAEGQTVRPYTSRRRRGMPACCGNAINKNVTEEDLLTSCRVALR
jgi:hypothetical protein